MEHCRLPHERLDRHCGVSHHGLARLDVEEGPAIRAVILAGVFPFSFFFGMVYTESLFLCSLLGFVYWSDEGSGRGLLLAALHGFVMTSTRLVGLPVVVKRCGNFDGGGDLNWNRIVPGTIR